MKGLDIAAPSMVLGQAIGRWGNFFNEEAFGRPTDLPWKLYISPEHRPLGYAQFEYFHPTFLYESLWDFAVFLLLVGLLRSRLKTRPGALFFAYVGLYSIGRFAIEALRLDSFWLGSRPRPAAREPRRRARRACGNGVGQPPRRRNARHHLSARCVRAGLERVGPYLWRIPQDASRGMRVPGLVVADDHADRVDSLRRLARPARQRRDLARHREGRDGDARHPSGLRPAGGRRGRDRRAARRREPGRDRLRHQLRRAPPRHLAPRGRDRRPDGKRSSTRSSPRSRPGSARGASWRSISSRSIRSSSAARPGPFAPATAIQRISSGSSQVAAWKAPRRTTSRRTRASGADVSSAPWAPAITFSRCRPSRSCTTSGRRARSASARAR